MSRRSIQPLSSVLQTIGYPLDGELSNRSPKESRAALDLAADNKVESLYLEALNETGELDELTEEYKRRCEYQNQMERTWVRINDLLEGSVKFAFVKSVHPFPADASDVDILVYNRDNLEGLDINFEAYDYEVLGTAPSASTIKDLQTGQLVDLQSFFGLHKVVYYNYRELVRNITAHQVNGKRIPVPAYPYDLSLIVNHSVTELMFLLKEYYATTFMLETSSEDDVLTFLEDIYYNESAPGCSAFLAVVEALSEEFFSTRPKHMEMLEAELGLSAHEKRVLLDNLDLPHRYSRKTLTKFTTRKFYEEEFRRSFIHQIPSFANPKTAVYILRKVYGRQSRETY